MDAPESTLGLMELNGYKTAKAIRAMIDRDKQLLAKLVSACKKSSDPHVVDAAVRYEENENTLTKLGMVRHDARWSIGRDGEG